LARAADADAPSARRSGRSASARRPPDDEPPATALDGGGVEAEREAAIAPEHAGLDELPAQEVRAPDEAGHEAITRALVQIALGADLLDGAGRHHHEAVGHRERLVLVVRDHHGRQAERALELADLDTDFLAQLRVEVRQRLVEQERIGLDDQRPRQRDPLLLAARELARQSVAEPLEAHQLERTRDFLADHRVGELAHFQAERDVLGGGEVGKERVALEDEPRVPAVGRQVRHVAAAESDPARRDGHEAGDHPQGRRLAAPARTEQHDQLALLDRQREVANGVEVTVALGHRLELDARHARG
jgi:hypothetical protein